MRLTITPIDGAVYKDNAVYSGLVWAGTPDSVHAVQWFDTYGWIEFRNGTPNQDITALPQWTDNALAAWQAAYDDAHRPPTLEEAKDAKRAAINGWRDQARFSNVTAIGHVWQADANSQALLSSSISLGADGTIPFPTVWRDIANENVAVTPADLRLIAQAIAVQTNNAYEHSWTLKAQVDAATTIAQVDAIQW